MGHDQLFKDFLREFLRDFLELFCPEIAKRLDFDGPHHLDKEVFTDFPEGSKREADLAVEVRTHEGMPGLVLIHIEVQARPRPDFPGRMFQYYTLLGARYQAPVFPLVVYLRGGRNGLSIEEYRVALFGEEQLRFRYRAVALARLPAREYVRRGNPVAAALAALMKKPREPVPLRALMSRVVAGSDLDEARKFLLLNLIKTYFELSVDQEEKFHRLLLNEEYREAREMEVTWADKVKEEGRQEGRQEGRLEGRQEGRQEGLIEGKREFLLRLLTRKFGALPGQTTTRVRALESLDELDAYLDRVITAESLDDIKLEA